MTRPDRGLGGTSFVEAHAPQGCASSPFAASTSTMRTYPTPSVADPRRCWRTLSAPEEGAPDDVLHRDSSTQNSPKWQAACRNRRRSRHDPLSGTVWLQRSGATFAGELQCAALAAARTFVAHIRLEAASRRCSVDRRAVGPQAPAWPRSR